MRYKPERALTLIDTLIHIHIFSGVEMRYKPERALTQDPIKACCIVNIVTTQAHEGIETYQVSVQ